MLQTLNGLVLRQRRLVNDGSRQISILTDNGIINAFVNGTNRKNSSLQSAVQPLCYSQFVLFENKERYSVNTATATETFFELTKDIEALALAQYLCEAALELSVQHDYGSEPLRLMLNALFMLAKKKRPMEQIKAIVELRLMCLAGFMPDIVMCKGCGCYQNERMLFLPNDGTIICSSCAASDDYGVWLSPSALTALRHIVLSPLDRLFNFKIGEQALEQLVSAAELFLLTKTQKSFAALGFYKSLQIQTNNIN